MSRAERGSFTFEKNIVIKAYAAVVGKKEGEGPLKDRFDRVYKDNLLGEDSWEKAESRLQQEAVNICMKKCGRSPEDFDAIFSGDLLNQCIASTFGIRSLGIPDIGMYGACSTMSSTLFSAAVMQEAGCAQRCIALTSSHFSSSERQYRSPVQYGGQRPPTAQWTVTGSGAIAVEVCNNGEDSPYPDSENSGADKSSSEANREILITSATIGIIQDLGIKDPNNMGAAMAPAAASTIERHLRNIGTTPQDYDLILTGDLGFVGSELLIELLLRDGIDISMVHNDGGMMIFNREEQDVHAGGSGCGCSASVLCGDILPKMRQGQLGRVLFVGTGALLSPTSSFQGESIPSVAHAVELCAR